jgi:GT2 family glycosyltransferase
MNKTTVVILNWNGLSYLQRFLGRLVESCAWPGTEVCVADNGSTDGSVEWTEENFSEVRIIRFDRNYGFAGGYNRAIAQLDSEYIVLINSDIEVGDNWLQPLVGFMDENADAAACQPKIMSWDRRSYFEHAGAAGGFIDRYGYPFCRGRMIDYAEKDEGQFDDVTEIFWSSGACMIVRSSAWIKCGGFDEDFFAHMEEIDLCWRFIRAGYRVCYIFNSVVYHIGGGSLSYGSPLKIYLNFRNSLFMLYKNLPEKKFRTILFKRKILDGMAAFMFLFQGRFRYFIAVYKAHLSYYWSLGELRRKRKIARLTGDGRASEFILNKSVVFEFYLRGNKTYNSLRT